MGKSFTMQVFRSKKNQRASSYINNSTFENVSTMFNYFRSLQNQTEKS